ncbi:MAG: type II toxin-antitoxin system RelE/ParE family toxin [Pseudomonadota bacterium]
MPRTDVLIYQEDDGTCPLTYWLDDLPPKAQEKCIVRIERLAEKGHELRRPEAAYLRDKIYELRAALQGTQYRILYFFSEKRCIITHGFIKEGNEVPPKEISLAVTRKAMFEDNPMKHTVRG